MQWFWMLERESERGREAEIENRVLQKYGKFAFCMNTPQNQMKQNTRKLWNVISIKCYSFRICHNSNWCVYFYYFVYPPFIALHWSKKHFNAFFHFLYVFHFKWILNKNTFSGFIYFFCWAFSIKSCCNFQTFLAANHIYIMIWMKQLVNFGKTPRQSSPLTSFQYELPWMREIDSFEEKKNSQSSIEIWSTQWDAIFIGLDWWLVKRTILKLLQLRSALFSRQSPCCQSTFNEITSDAIPKNHCFSTATRCNQTHCCIYVLQRKLVPESYNIYFMNLHLRRFICISIESAWRGIGEVYSICSLCLGYMQVVVEAISMLTWSEYAIDLTILLLMQRTAFIWKIIQMRDFFFGNTKNSYFVCGVWLLTEEWWDGTYSFGKTFEVFFSCS